MINKEVRYNAISLVSTWLGNTKDISDLRLVFNNNTSSMIVPCTTDNCGNNLADVLLNNKGGYTSVKLLGSVKRENKVFGELDIN